MLGKEIIEDLMKRFFQSESPILRKELFEKLYVILTPGWFYAMLRTGLPGKAMHLDPRNQ